MLATMDAAIFWRSIGVSTIPVLEKSKLPAQDWKSFQSRLPTDSEIINWFARTRKNIGVVCGGSRNLTVLDFDDIKNYYNWRADMNGRNDVWEKVSESSYKVKTSRGMHVYVMTEKPERSRKFKKYTLDIRSQNGMVVAPPSIHPTGFKYEQLSDLAEKNIIHVGSTTEIFPELYDSNIIEIATKESSDPRNPFDFSFNSSIKEIKDQVRILDYLSGITFMRRTSANGRWWMAKCPYPAHNDRHPSFRIDTLTNRAKCMSSSCPLNHDIGYDIIDLHKQIYGMDTKSAIEDILLRFM